MKNADKQITETVITANLEGLAQRLSHMSKLATEAAEIMKRGEQNLAIGTVLEFERSLPEVDALFKTAILMHRNSV